tara:strand:- start:1261 stop:1524 length:264 start_codon:yes stop_codon:yes gene_type:complete
MDIDVDVNASNEEEAILFTNVVGYFDALTEEGANAKSLATMMMTFSTSYLYSFFPINTVDKIIEQIKEQILESKTMADVEEEEIIKH